MALLGLNSLTATGTNQGLSISPTGTGVVNIPATLDITRYGNTHFQLGANYDTYLTYGSTGAVYLRTYNGTSYVNRFIIDANGRLTTGLVPWARLEDVPTSLSNTVNLTGDQTIAGVKTFSSAPIISNTTQSLVFNNSGTTKRGIIGTVGDNDQWFFGGGATASNAGFLEIATGDDGGTEPIHVRQYQGGTPLTGTITRTLTLLDSSGNSSFPGAITTASTLSLGTQATTTSHAVRADRSISTGDGLTGGGDLTTNRTLSVQVVSGGGISAISTGISVDSTVVRTSSLTTQIKTIGIGDARLTADFSGSTGAANYMPTPAQFNDKAFTPIFTQDWPQTSSWAGILTTKGWTGTNYSVWQLAGTSHTSAVDEWYLRTGLNTTWNAWRRIWHNGNSDPVNLSGNQTISGTKTFNGLIDAFGSTGVISVNTAGNRKLEIRGNGGSGDAAYMTFHRPGAFAVRFGLDTNNRMRVGGWSLGNVAYDVILGDSFANPSTVGITATNQLLLKAGTASNVTTIVRNDGSDFYFLLSDASTDLNGTWNTLRPFAINLASGRLASANGQRFAGLSSFVGSSQASGVSGLAIYNTAGWSGLSITGSSTKTLGLHYGGGVNELRFGRYAKPSSETTSGAFEANPIIFNIDNGNATFTGTITAPLFNGSASLFDGASALTRAASLRANRNISGGGTITVNASYSVLWSSRFIVISNGRGAYFGTSGHFDITCPTSGTITGVGGAANVTATTAGIPLGAWQAIYYILPIGSTNGSVAANFRLASYTADANIPHDWVLICVRNGDNGAVTFNNGVTLSAGQSLNSIQQTDANTANTLVRRNASGNFTAGVITAALSGNATTATTWQTGRTIALTGDVTGTSAAFNGSENLSFATTLANSGVTAGTYRSVTVDAKGRVTTGSNPTTVAGYGITDAVTTFGNQTISGIKTFSSGIIPGSTQGYPNYESLLDFGSDVAGTWRRIVVVLSPNIQFSSIGFKIEITDPKANHATPGSVDSVITETYYVACVRTESTTLNTPDACYVRGPGNRIRATKVGIGSYQIHIQNEAQFREYRVNISVYAVNGGHFVSYSPGPAEAGIAQYNASISTTSEAVFQNLRIRAATAGSAATQIPVFTANPATTTRTLVTRTPAQLRGDIGAGTLSAVDLGITAGTTAGPIITNTAGTNATLPTASGTASGVVTTGNQTWAGTKTFNSPPSISVTSGTNVLSWTGSTRAGFIRKITNQGGALLCADSSLVLHAGDATNIQAELEIIDSTTAENLWLTADNNVSIITGRQAGPFPANGHEFVFNANGDLAGDGTITSERFQAYSVGVATEPSFTWFDNLNTGVYSPDTNQVGITTNGSQAAFWDANGNYRVIGSIGLGASGISNANIMLNASNTFTQNGNRRGVSLTLNTSSINLTANREQIAGIFAASSNQLTLFDSVNNTNRLLTVRGLYGQAFNGAENNSNSVATSVIGVLGIARNRGRQTVPNVYGLQSIVDNAGPLEVPNGVPQINNARGSDIAVRIRTGTTENAYGTHNYVRSGGISSDNGTITNGFGTYSLMQNSQGTYTRAFGSRVDFSGTIEQKIGFLTIGGADLDFAAQNTQNITFGHWNTNGTATPRMTINTAGNVGIGTISPEQLLHIRGTNAGAKIQTTNNTSGGILFLSQSNDTGASVEYNGATDPEAFQIKTYTSGTLTSTAMTIKLDGSVGIGTATPRAGFHLYGSGQTTANLTDSGNRGGLLRISQSGTAAGSGGGILFANEQGDNVNSLGFAAIKGLLINGANNTTGELAFSVRVGGTGVTALQEAMRISSSGKVGIGTSNPDQLLHVVSPNDGPRFDLATSRALIINQTNAGGQTFIELNNTAGSGVSKIGTNWGNAGAFEVFTPDTTAFGLFKAFDTNRFRTIFFTQGLERMRLDGSSLLFNHSLTTGFPGINNTNQGLTIEGVGSNGVSLFISRSNSTLLYLNRNSNGGAQEFRRSGVAVGSISVTASATAYNTSSDYRLKENVVPLSGAIDRLQQIPVYRFNFITEPNTIVDGFLAHEAQKIVPECVTGTKDEIDNKGNPVYQGIDQSKLVPLLTAALQEAITEIMSLKARVATLEGK